LIELILEKLVQHGPNYFNDSEETRGVWTKYMAVSY